VRERVSRLRGQVPKALADDPARYSRHARTACGCFADRRAGSRRRGAERPARRLRRREGDWRGLVPMCRHGAWDAPRRSMGNVRGAAACCAGRSRSSPSGPRPRQARPMYRRGARDADSKDGLKQHARAAPDRLARLRRVARAESSRRANQTRRLPERRTSSKAIAKPEATLAGCSRSLIISMAQGADDVFADPRAGRVGGA